jgi:hypothetical protein
MVQRLLLVSYIQTLPITFHTLHLHTHTCPALPGSSHLNKPFPFHAAHLKLAPPSFLHLGFPAQRPACAPSRHPASQIGASHRIDARAGRDGKIAPGEGCHVHRIDCWASQDVERVRRKEWRQGTGEGRRLDRREEKRWQT